MNIERRTTKEGYVQITTEDERFYLIEGQYIPSVTWICSHYPRGTEFYKWLASKGWDEAEAIKVEAGIRGSRVHTALERLLNGQAVRIDDLYLNKENNREEGMSAFEWRTVMTFVDWFNEYNPTVLGVEFTTVNKAEKYAGTVDLLCEIQSERWIVDFKTSANIYPSHELQLSAYKHALEPEYGTLRTAILQVGYSRNKKGWKFTEIEDKYHLFKASQEIWRNECENITPKQYEYPIELKLPERK